MLISDWSAINAWEDLLIILSSSGKKTFLSPPKLVFPDHSYPGIVIKILLSLYCLVIVLSSFQNSFVIWKSLPWWPATSKKALFLAKLK